MEEKVLLIKKELEEKLEQIKDLKTLNELRVEYLGKKGPISSLTSMMASLSIEEKKSFGKLLNDLKNEATEKIDSLKEKLEKEELNKKLENERIDISLPATKIQNGSPNILEKMFRTCTVSSNVIHYHPQ